ncbi:hypothetical protein SLEP1_g36692 [Rubroshorea leprosula]|uniref:Uncharacterized protein n=1 Tax=Rubroshorea leprosula TaxID=152421 RepID=A0AAV5KSJ5_9ROSI|nr:hypothetical protein SLEP1_g36692 [Rubroshorea leprosula]
MLDEEGKAVVGFLQVDEDEEGIGAGFLQVLGSKVLGLILNPGGTGFRFEPSNR